MIDSEKPKRKQRAKTKPPTQIAGVNGIDAHGGMGEAPIDTPFQQYVSWHKLVDLPAFQMFVYEQSGQQAGAPANDWVAKRRATLSDSVLYEQYATWHKDKGLWVNETPIGRLIKG